MTSDEMRQFAELGHLFSNDMVWRTGFPHPIEAQMVPLLKPYVVPAVQSQAARDFLNASRANTVTSTTSSDTNGASPSNDTQAKAAPAKSGGSIISGLVSMFILLSVLVRCFGGSNDSESSKSSSAVNTTQATGSATQVAKPPTPAKIPPRMSAREARQKMQNNELRFRREVEEAGGVIVTARVRSVESGVLFSGPLVHLQAGEVFEDVLATLKRSESARAEKINNGDRVELLCHNPTTIGGAFHYLYDCEIK